MNTITKIRMRMLKGGKTKHERGHFECCKTFEGLLHSGPPPSFAIRGRTDVDQVHVHRYLVPKGEKEEEEEVA